MTFRSLTLTVTALSLLTACASIVEGSTQEVQVLTSPATAGGCKLKNKRGEWHTANTPGTVTVKRSTSDLNVTCGDSYSGGRSVASSGIEPWTLGNLLLGGVIGLAIDGMTGSLSKYQDTVTVPVGAGFGPAPTDSTIGYGGAASAPAAAPVAPATAYTPESYAPAVIPAYPAAAPAAAPAPSYYGGVPTQPGLLPLPPRNPNAVAPAPQPAAQPVPQPVAQPVPVFQPTVTQPAATQPVAAPTLTQPASTPFHNSTSPYMKPSRY